MKNIYKFLKVNIYWALIICQEAVLSALNSLCNLISMALSVSKAHDLKWGNADSEELSKLDKWHTWSTNLGLSDSIASILIVVLSVIRHFFSKNFC